MKWLRRFFAGFSSRERVSETELTRSFEQNRILLRVYYFIFLFFASDHLPAWEQFPIRGELATLWPVEWMQWGFFPSGVYFLTFFCTATALLGALWPERRWVRVAVFLGFFEYVALVNSFGKIGHSLHAWVLTAFLLIFLPDEAFRPGRVTRVIRQQFSTVLWAIQATLLLTYTMAGLSKVGGALYQAWIGEVHAFALNAMPLHIADRLLQTGARSAIGEWMIDHPLLCYPLMLGTVYLQVFSFWVAFRPSIQRWWAVGLIFFHVMSYFTLTIIFPQNVLLLALLFFYPPFESRRASWREMFLALPLVGDVMRWWFYRRNQPCVS
jgi:hypothetical protein